MMNLLEELYYQIGFWIIIVALRTYVIHNRSSSSIPFDETLLERLA